MKIKAILVALFLVLFGSAVAFEAASVKAEEANNSPITSPITYFLVKGRTFYVFLGQTYPARNVLVQATNTSTRQELAVYSNQNGEYSISLQNGLYRFWVVDSKKRFFDPFGKWVNVSKDIENLNFYRKVYNLPQ